MSTHEKPDPMLGGALATCLDSGPYSGPFSGVLQRVLARISPEGAATMSRWTLLRAVGLAAASGMLLAIMPVLWNPQPSHAAPKLETIAVSGPVAAHVDTLKPLTARPDAPQPLTLRAAAPEPLMVRATAPRLSRRAARQARRLARVRNRSMARQAAIARRINLLTSRAALSREEIGRARFVRKTPRARQKAPIEVQRVTDAPLSISAVSLTPIELSGEGKE
jgi:hypothetical protein